MDVDIWSVTSYSELRTEAEDVSRWNILHPDDEYQIPYITKCLEHTKGPVVAVSDYVKLVAEQISPFISGSFTALGTDGFGRSEAREDLRRFFEIDRYYIILAALNTLAQDGQIQLDEVKKAIKKYKIDTEKPNPKTV